MVENIFIYLAHYIIGVSLSSFPLIYGLNLYLSVFLTIISFWIITEMVGGFIIPSRRREGSEVQERKRGLNFTTWLGWEAFVVFTIVSVSFKLFILPGDAFFAGIIIFLLGVGIRQWAVAVLGKYFSHVVGIQKDQKVIDIGPYHYVRPPSYTGILLIQIGIALMFQSWAAVLVAAISFSLAYGHRILKEEKFLVEELGDSYRQYMAKTKRIIPFLL